MLTVRCHLGYLMFIRNDNAVFIAAQHCHSMLAYNELLAEASCTPAVQVQGVA